MKSIHFKAFLLLIASLAQMVQAQEQGVDNWNVPWVIIGDSTLNTDRNSKVVVTGTVLDAESQQPIGGASVAADFFKYYDYSDENGAYVLELPPGNYRVRIKHVGMLPVYTRIKVFSRGVLNVQMQEGVVQLSEVLITSRPVDSNIKGSVPGLMKLDIQEIKTLPTLMGETDIVKTLQLMPGVSSVGEGASGINVRGGRVDQNLVLLNDVPLFNTAHALGFVSAFNQDVIKDFSLYKGNVPASFGGRASSVLEINTRRGNFDEWQFHGGTGPVSTRFSAEGPVADEKSSVLLAGRISHANWLTKKISNPDVNRSELSFMDGFAGFTHRFNENNSADIIFYNSNDSFRFSDRFGYRWDNYLVNARWQSAANRKLSPTLSASYGHYKNTLFEPEGVSASIISNGMDYFQVKENVHYIPSENHDVRAGVSAIAYLPRDEQRRPYGPHSSVTEKRTGKSSGLELAVFANDEYRLNDQILISIGMRYSQYYHVGPDTVFRYTSMAAKSVSAISDTALIPKRRFIDGFSGIEPRVSARINLSANQAVKLSYNRMRQYIHLISNTTTPTPVDTWQVATEVIPPQTADNYSVGYFLNLKDNSWETSAEIFYKKMSDLVEYKDFPELFLNPHLETELLTGKGRAYGAELLVRKLKGNWTGWLSYTWSRSEVIVSSPYEGQSINNGEWYPGNYNKPHHLSLICNRRLQRRGAFSLIFSYQSGRPFTAVESSYMAGGTVIPVYSDRNEYNIPDYLRVDLSLTIGNVFKKLEDSLAFSVYNLLGRANAYSVFYQRPAPNYYIPKPYKLSVLGSAFPSVSYNVKF